LEEIIELKNRFYILATSSLADDRTHVLQHDHTFAVFDRHGDVQPLRFNEQGMYWLGTRHLSRIELRINKERLPLLSSAVLDDNLLLTADLTNPDIFKNGEVMIPRGTLHFFRSKFLWEGVCYERILIWNYSVVPLEVSFSILLEADFMDIFEVRGMKRKKRGQLLKTVVGENHILYSYKGLDGMVRRTTVACSPSPNKISDSELRFDAKLNPKTEATFYLTLSCGSDDSPPAPLLTFNQGFSKAKSLRRKVETNDCQVSTSNEQFNDWLNRSFNDLHMMLTKTSDGLYPFAGVPWFSTVFGRDGIITALETLWIGPDIAKGVLTVLSSTQATEDDPENDAEPGKIIHEMRKGEMAQLKEVPFGRYYGSVDATPLFIILAGAYYEKTGDKDHIKKI